MRFLLKVNIPVESGNAAAKAGKLGATIQSILADLKPEAVYFTDNNGPPSCRSNPSHRRAVVPRVQRQRCDPSGHDTGRLQSQRRHRERGQEIHMIGRAS